MPLVPAKCPECGGLVEVDSEKKAGLCQHCGQPFVVEDAIQTFNTYYQTTNNYNTTHNYGDGAVVNVYEDKNKDFVIEAGVLKEYHGASRDVVIPDSVEEISEDCFADMNIHSITIPKSVNKICKPFGCKLYDLNWGYSIKNTHIDFIIDDNERFEYVNNCIIDKINKSIVFAQKDIEEFPIFKDFDIQVVEFGAFIGCNNLRKIIFPDNIKRLEMCSFQGCELNNVYFEHDIEIKYDCFRNCWKLKSIICKDNVRLKLDSNIFDGCKNIEFIVSKDIFNIAKNKSKDLGLVGLINPIVKDGIICASFSPMLYSEEKGTYRIYDSYERYLSLNNKNINKYENTENYIESRAKERSNGITKTHTNLNIDKRETLGYGATIEEAILNAKNNLNAPVGVKVSFEIMQMPSQKLFSKKDAIVKAFIEN